MIGKVLCGAVCVMLAAAPAVAQKEQTPATAQEFLQVTSANATVGFQIAAGSSQRNNYSAMRFTGTYASDNCTSQMKGVDDHEFFNEITRRWERIQNSNYEYGIYWKYISKVTRTYQSVRLDWSNGISPIVLTYPTEDLATRAAFAMEFLRVQCDPTSGLAF